MTSRIAVVGSLNMDLVVRSPHLPRRGETVLGGTFATYPGGKGANQAVAAALAVGLAEVRDLVDAAEFANAVGALSVPRAGAQPSMLRREEVEAFMG